MMVDAYATSQGRLLPDVLQVNIFGRYIVLLTVSLAQNQLLRLCLDATRKSFCGGSTGFRDVRAVNETSCYHAAMNICTNLLVNFVKSKLSSFDAVLKLATVRLRHLILSIKNLHDYIIAENRSACFQSTSEKDPFSHV